MAHVKRIERVCCKTRSHLRSSTQTSFGDEVAHPFAVELWLKDDGSSSISERRRPIFLRWKPSFSRT